MGSSGRGEGAGGIPVGFLKSRPLEELRPEWLHRDADGARPSVDVGLTFDCPRCRDIPNGRDHRLELWFCATRSHHDLTIGSERPRLFDHAGTRFRELTVWKEKPPPRDPLIEVDHWIGYIEAGHVYDALRFGGL